MMTKDEFLRAASELCGVMPDDPGRDDLPYRAACTAILVAVLASADPREWVIRELIELLEDFARRHDLDDAAKEN